MRILTVHNYFQRPGGEDEFESEAALLEAHGNGHLLLRAQRHHRCIWQTALAGRAIWSGSAYNDIRSLCRTERPDVVHFHNTLPLISPSAYHAAKAEGRCRSDSPQLQARLSDGHVFPRVDEYARNTRRDLRGPPSRMFDRRQRGC